jgi:molecular chaperone GrpE (heat shock protein)
MSDEVSSAETPPEMVEVSSLVLQELREQASKAEEYLTLAKYAKADFINYQDRVRRDKEDWNRQALNHFVTDLLPALDGFAMAKFEDANLMEAIRMLEREFIRVLSKYGIVPIDTGTAFDPLLHEAVAAEPGGTRLEEVRRGWMIQGKVLRAASVRIVKPPPEVY